MPELKKANIWIGLTVLLTLTLAYMFFQHHRTNRRLRWTAQEAANQATENLCYLVSFNKFSRAISEKVGEEESERIAEEMGYDTWQEANPDLWAPAEFFGRVFLHVGTEAQEEAYKFISDFGACHREKALLDSQNDRL